jgi:hypothetical protein
VYVYDGKFVKPDSINVEVDGNAVPAIPDTVCVEGAIAHGTFGAVNV